MSGDGLHRADSTPARTLAALVTKATGVSPLDCYQCGRCAAGCAQNVAGEMDLSPTRIMRLLQNEAAFAGSAQGEDYAKRALGAETPWLCAGCLACTTRCPQQLDIARTMDVLREEGLERKLTARTKRVRDIQALHRVFLRAAMKRGRLHEMSMIMAYKLRTGHLLQDAMLAPKMFWRGKLHILGGEKPGAARAAEAAEKLRQADGGGE